jgi:hypothetical protein
MMREVKMLKELQNQSKLQRDYLYQCFNPALISYVGFIIKTKNTYNFHVMGVSHTNSGAPTLTLL